MKLAKYSLGIGDRFGHEGQAQLKAFIKAREQGVSITPVWNKSNREHTIIGTQPSDTRNAADEAVKACGWKNEYHIDADHIGLATVDRFIEPSDFFTVDVADFIGKPSTDADLQKFISDNQKYIGALKLPKLNSSFEVTHEILNSVGQKYLFAVKEAGKIYRHIAKSKIEDSFITEISMDETSQPQTPVEIFFILAAIAQEGIPIQTIAPKFSGRFNKGVDYVGDVAQFTREFEQDLDVITLAIKEFGLPSNLKLSIHSGSDKFSIYKSIHQSIKKFDAGLHVKTAGTNWLEEVAGLAEADGEGLKMAKEIYAQAYEHLEELCKPYATVIDIDPTKLPEPSTVKNWSSQDYVNTLRHVQSCKQFNPHFRQLLHVGFKVAAKMGDRYLQALKTNRKTISSFVTDNLYSNHIKSIFLG